MLYIAEKPELARAIVEALGEGGKKNGYYECGRDRVTWCFGHMLRLWEPEEYDASLKKWTLDTLPLVFTPWKKRPVEKAKEQLQIILELLKSADTVVNAGDPDAEGQLLVDEILHYAGFKGKVLRVLINDNTPVLVKKALANLRDNADFAGMSAAAEARQVGDWHYGLNLTRLYTLVGRREGYSDMLSVGRVQTPILGLVVRRDRERESHQKSAYYVIQGKFQVCNVSFTATYRNKPDDFQGEKGRLINQSSAQAVADAVGGKTARIASVETKKGETPPTLPYNLLALQVDASRLHGLAPDKVREITQSLREKHRLITYNRSDSRHLSEEQHADAPAVIAAIAANVPEFAAHVGRTDAARKSRAFDSSKVTAHHAIIPTQAKPNFSTLSLDEKRLYLMIAKAYLMQFMAPQTWERTVATLEVEGHAFVHSCRVIVENGWRDSCTDEVSENGDDDRDEEEGSISVPLVSGGDASCLSGACVSKETTPKPIYTMASLLGDLTRVAQYVRDDRLRKLLIDKDKGKAGEHGGIGTSATRDVIIRTLFDRGFIETKKTGKSAVVVSTKVGRDFYDALPNNAKYPDLTALWHQQQLDIERGELTADAFVEELVRYIGGECARVIKDGLDLKITSMHPCPACGKPMRFIKHAKGEFWACTGFPSCKKTLKADGDKPAAGKHPQASTKHACKQCGKGLIRRKTKDGKFFWGRSGYPDCRMAYPDQDGIPNYAAKGEKTKK